MPLQPGDRLGPYQIVAVIGSGAMGDVYRARDTRLNRIVAIKVSKQQFSERFEREAVAVAALNSPHVCQLYDVGPNYLVMEFVDGTPLQPVERPDKLLDIATQIADGLMAAHAAGIIHRDLKPANIHITADGQVKILDFGLAIGDAKSAGASDVTAAAGITHAGTTVGTIAYMSPEQARGRDIDTRSDLWALGVTLYELATGVRPFDGPTTAVIFEGILNRSPVPVQERNPAIPAEIARIIDRLLDKDRETRYQSAADVRADLKRAGRGTTSTAVTAPVADRGPSTAVAIDVQVSANRKRTARRFAIMTAIALTSVAAAVAYLYFPRSPVTSPSEYVQVTNFTDSATAPVLSPDGRMVAFIRGGDYFLSSGQIYVKLLPNGDAIRLTDTPVPKLAPAFTADGSRVAYTLLDVKRNPVSWDTWAVPVYGGDATQLLPNAAGLVWLDEQRVMFSEMKPPGIHMGIVTSTEGRADHRDIYLPAHERAMAHYSWASPDRKTVLVVEMDRTAAWQQCRLVPFDGSSPGQPIGPAGTCIAAGWSPDGKWMYFNAQVGGSFHLWRQRFPDGTPQQITFGPSEEEGLAVAPDGKSLVTSVGLRHASIWVHDPDGERALSSEGLTFAPLLSRDAKRVYYLARQTSAPPSELWTLDLSSGKTERLVPGLSVLDFDISPDETEVAFTTRPAGGNSQIWLASLDRRSPPRRVIDGADSVSFAARGELLVRTLGDKSNSLERVKKDGSGRERIGNYLVLDKLRASPDGEWIGLFVATGGEAGGIETLVVPVYGGAPIRICPLLCPFGWSTDGRLFHVTIGQLPAPSSVGRTLIVPVAPGRVPPELPQHLLALAGQTTRPPGTQVIDRPNIELGPGGSTYVFVKGDLQRNLFRIPLH